MSAITGGRYPLASTQHFAASAYTHLFERRRLDLTVEAMIVEGARWHVLFTIDEIAAARNTAEEASGGERQLPSA
jgi:hypothetical protein